MAVFKCSIEESGGLDYAKVLRGYKTLPLVEVGDEIRARMVQIIDVNRKREVRDTYDPFLKKDRPHLKDVLKVEVFGHGNGIGIGNIDELQEKAPYWRVLNNGGYTPPATAGWFGSGNPQGGDSAFTMSKVGH